MPTNYAPVERRNDARIARYALGRVGFRLSLCRASFCVTQSCFHLFEVGLRGLLFRGDFVEFLRADGLLFFQVAITVVGFLHDIGLRLRRSQGLRCRHDSLGGSRCSGLRRAPV